MKLTFGYSQGVPDDATAAWGARALAHYDGRVELLHDRQSTFGPADEVRDLLVLLNAGINLRWMEKAGELLRSQDMTMTRADEHELYCDDKVKVVGNTNGSGGYLYVAAFPVKG